MSDQINYILQFADQGAAQRDPVVGPFLVPGFGGLEALVYADVTQDSVNALSGYWVMVTEANLDPALLNHPNLQIANDRNAQIAGQPSVVKTNIPVANIGIVINGFGNYANGLVSP